MAQIGDLEMPRTALAGYAPLASMSLEELMAGYEAKQVAYLDLRQVKPKGSSKLINIGPNACLAGDLKTVKDEAGTPTQVIHHSPLEST